VTFSEALESPKWPSVDVSIFSCGLKTNRSNNSLTYAPNIECVFELKDQTYSGTEYDFSSSYGSKSSAQKKLLSLENQENIKLFYKPSDPSVNVIHPGIRLVHFLRLIFGAAISILCSLMWSGIIDLPSQ
jgi:hypothetical protein